MCFLDNFVLSTFTTTNRSCRVIPIKNEHTAADTAATRHTEIEDNNESSTYILKTTGEIEANTVTRKQRTMTLVKNLRRLSPIIGRIISNLMTNATAHTAISAMNTDAGDPPNFRRTYATGNTITITPPTTDW